MKQEASHICAKVGQAEDLDRLNIREHSAVLHLYENQHGGRGRESLVQWPGQRWIVTGMREKRAATMFK